MIIQISAGQGPAECQLAVAKLWEALKKEYGEPELLSYTEGAVKGCYESVRFRTGQDLSGLEGTVLWKCKSPFRKDHKRKNWYVDVSVIHVPTGLCASSAQERSQLRNKEIAMEKLQEKLRTLRQEEEKKQSRAAWEEHNRIVRGNPVRIYEGERFSRK